MKKYAKRPILNFVTSRSIRGWIEKRFVHISKLPILNVYFIIVLWKNYGELWTKNEIQRNVKNVFLPEEVDLEKSQKTSNIKNRKVALDADKDV